MSFNEDDLVPISALQHLIFCPRQCALIHLERLWADNQWTAEGHLLHKRAESGKSTTRDGIRITRDLPLHSLKYGLIGKADIIEWHPPSDLESQAVKGTLKEVIHQYRTRSLADWTILPIEYKRGQPKQNDSDRVQLCAQALCLEEMLHVSISKGLLFYGKKQHRYEVVLDESLRQTTIDTIQQMHDLITSGRTPQAEFGPKCQSCSLYDLCLPQSFQQNSVSQWLNQQVNHSLK
ncbi:CRISPR-associated protein Cas4 [Gimesia benthica]|uniref:CRISPR-associated exonuclease Cas4 n=1 Tax=Gimesia benthica TaxID=2608982 RepID=A0A6I6AH71_9PLAN|nr:CRISPR-associated protein Cas4 [Gimesia benthica]QGQ25747.1 CRISPR-associated protein Cas4 [Gimesia benthica]|tara:strand:+ start:427 stop:1131 length:705 start_codon:yes stop_codon:yes gene_type:complete